MTCVLDGDDVRACVSSWHVLTHPILCSLGQCKYSIKAEEECHKEWVSCVRFSPNLNTPLIVSAGWDKIVKVSGEDACMYTTYAWIIVAGTWSS